MFYADKPRGRRNTQGHLNNASNQLNRVRSRFYAGDGNPNQAQTRFRTAGKHPNRAKIAQMALSTAPIKPEWASQPLLNNHPKSKVNGFPEK